jgi:hypothetical protein
VRFVTDTGKTGRRYSFPTGTGKVLIMRSILPAAAAVLLASLAGPAMGAGAPTALAAWSQITGSVDQGASGSTVPPAVELRFVVAAGSDCANYTATYDTDAGKGQASGVRASPRTGPWTDIVVCTLPMDASWTAATLEMSNGAGREAVVLDSKVNRGSYANTATNVFYADSGLKNKSPWEPGVSDGATVTVAGPASIGAGGKLTMVSIGDTGCRGKPPNHGQQDCEASAGGDAWPLPELAAQAAKDNPDLVIHVGDYRYFYERDNSTTAWVYWQKDFFPAAQPLLLAAPWVFIRGNHESCDPSDKPFGPGYFQLFGWQAGETCDQVDAGANKDGGLQYTQPWFFDVQAAGTGAAEAHRFVIVDVNDFGEGVNQDQAEADFSIAAAMSSRGPESSWWVMHTPGVQVIYYGGAEHKGQKEVRHALRDATGFALCGSIDKPAACKPSQFLLGHEHLYQSVVFPRSLQGGANGADAYAWAFPRMFITGHGGTQLVYSSPTPGGAGPCEYAFDDIGVPGLSGDLNAIVDTVTEHGYVAWTREAGSTGDPSGWSPSFVWADG